MFTSYAGIDRPDLDACHQLGLPYRLTDRLYGFLRIDNHPSAQTLRRLLGNADNPQSSRCNPFGNDHADFSRAQIQARDRAVAFFAPAHSTPASLLPTTT